MARRAKRRPGRNGDCYEAAAKLLLKLPPEVGAVLVHGQPVLRRPPFARYGHAWVEVGGACLDTGNGLSVALPREVYYGLGQIEAAECRRYTVEQATALLLDRKHYGPWEET